MNSVNVNIPVVNLPQVSHTVSHAHHAPMAHQEQNADIARAAFDLQLTIAREAEAADGKIVDPEDHKEDSRKRDKKKKKKNGNGDADEKEDMTDGLVMSESGRLIDLEA